MFTYANYNSEVIIYYHKSMPFVTVKFALSVALSTTSDLYELFEYESHTNNETDVKVEIETIANFLIDYRNSILKHYKLYKESVLPTNF